MRREDTAAGSAFQKSIRGADENAALHYLARLVSAGDLPSVCRRLLVIASEDIGLAYPQAVSVVKSCVDAAKEKARFTAFSTAVLSTGRNSKIVARLKIALYT